MPIRVDAAKASIRYEIPALATVETKQDPQQFAAERAAKIAAMDVTEVARRIAFIFAAATREKSNANQPRPEPEARVRH